MFLGILLGLFMVVSSAYVFFRWEWKAIAIFIPIILLTLYFSSGGKEIPGLVAPVILGGIGGISFKKRKSFQFYFIISAAAISVFFAGGYYYLINHNEVDLLKLSRVEMKKVLTESKTPDDIKGEILRDYEGWIESARNLIPLVSFLYSMLAAGVMFLAMRIFFSRFMDTKSIPGLEMFRMNDFFIFTLIGGWLLYLLVDKSVSPFANMLGLNTALIASSLYFIQALGVLKYIAKNKGIPGYVIPLSLFVVSLTGLEVLMFILVFLTGFGTLDFWADFRKLSNNENKLNNA
ncbi:MAG: YybS family protein [Spirochaetes bacterium]|jgi:hypothetical protein|nr:YybS family protein [Spirochaetota bacterium]